MSKKYIRKNLRLGVEFDRYIIDHPTAYRKIPRKATIVITDKNDPAFTRESLVIAGIIVPEKHPNQRSPLIEAQKSGSRWLIRPLAI